ncbi:MAG: hypothetical protein R3C03_22490 [Pirellulaceae bacterium]
MNIINLRGCRVFRFGVLFAAFVALPYSLAVAQSTQRAIPMLDTWPTLVADAIAAGEMSNEQRSQLIERAIRLAQTSPEMAIEPLESEANPSSIDDMPVDMSDLGQKIDDLEQQLNELLRRRELNTPFADTTFHLPSYQTPIEPHENSTPIVSRDLADEIESLADAMHDLNARWYRRKASLSSRNSLRAQELSPVPLLPLERNANRSDRNVR